MWKNILLFLTLSGPLGHHASPTIKLYHYVAQKMNWNDAQRHCREQFDDLATVDNPEEFKRLQESRSSLGYDNEWMWIGLYDDRTRWQWVHGNQDYKLGQHYGNWATSNPNNYRSRENCTVMGTTGKWSDYGCDNLCPAVCFDDKGNYIYVQSRMTWSQARKTCQSNNTELASVRNATENSKISAMLRSSAWIGLHRDLWSHWSDGSRVTYGLWRDGTPDNYGGMQNCVIMFATSGYFDDEGCSQLHHFACQELGKQRSTFTLKISSEADMTDPEVQRQVEEQLHAKLTKEGMTGVKLRLVLKDVQDPKSKK